MPIDEFELHQRIKDDKRLDMPIRGVVTSVLPEKETYKISSYSASGEAQYAVRHPFLGVNSWIRAVGEPGTTVLIQARGDLKQQEIWGYISNKTSGLLKKAIVDETVAYRVLQPGEIEIMSSGKASAFFGGAGDLEFRGGVLSHNLLQSESEISSAAPTHRRTWWRNTPISLAHEERMGIVKRPNPLWPYTQQEPVKLVTGNYALEYGRWVNDDLNQALVVTQEGNVIDQLGLTIKQFSTTKDLRYRKVITGVTGGTLSTEVDEDLNVSIFNASPSRETKINFGATNEVTWNAKKWTVQVTDSGSLTFTQSLAITSQKVQVNSANVVFGMTGIEQVLLGTTFYNSVFMPLITTMQAMFSTIATSDPVTMLAKLQASSIAMQSVLTAIQAMGPTAVLSTQVRLSG